MQLTDKAIRSAKAGSKAVKLTDGAGLYLELSTAGGKLWRYRFRIAGKENVFAIGAYPQVTLADARKARDDARVLVKQGINPAHARQQMIQGNIDESKNTFAVSAEAWFAGKVSGWSAGHAGSVRRVLDKDILTAPQAHDVVKAVVVRGALTRAVLARLVMRNIFDYGALHHGVTSNPADALKGTIKTNPVQNRRDLKEAHVGGFLRALVDYSGHPTTRLALQILIHTAVRPGELLGASWSEFDLDAARWDIPADRMKMRRPHIVPLSLQAVEYLRELEQITGDSPFLFPSQSTRGGTQPGQTLGRAIARLGFSDRCSPHGLRGTFSTMLNERGYRSDCIEMQLAHVSGTAVRKAYNHAQHLQERRTMMQDYANLLEELKHGAKVIPIKRTA